MKRDYERLQKKYSKHARDSQQQRDDVTRQEMSQAAEVSLLLLVAVKLVDNGISCIKTKHYLTGITVPIP